MKRQQTLGSLLALVASGLAAPPHLSAQGVAPPTAQGTTARLPSSLEVNLLRSLQANPVTAPYGFATEPQGRKIILHGRVGTKQVHDVAIQTAIGLGVPVVDALVIDTAAAHQAVAPAYGSQGYGGGGGMGFASGYGGAGFGYPGAGYPGTLPYTYPQPLFGRLDDPFFGFEPPAIAYPPWWGALTARRLGPPSYPPAPAAPGPPAPAPSNNAAGDPAAGAIPDGTIDMTIDGRGVATIRGTVPSLTDRVAIGQQIARTPGVSQVVNLLNVRASVAAAAAASGMAPGDAPPPIPTPADSAPPAPQVPTSRPNPAVVDGPPIAVDPEPLAQRVARAIASKSALAGQPIKVKVRDGVASLSGRVPTIYEAMLAYRAVQQTPGVREVADQLEFVVPDGSGPNPLADKGRPEDVEPYLAAQIRRQVGDLAHLDRVRVHGDSLELRGSLARAEDRPRFDAILRSMPILRGFRLTAEFTEAVP